MSGSIKEQRKSGHGIVVIGGSAGVTDALLELLEQLPETFPAAIFVAYHVPPGMEGSLHKILTGAGTLEVKLADDREPIRRGIVYVARADHHLLVNEKTLRVTRGPRENGWRPAIDPLFRSAAVSHGSRVIGIVLTGMLDDGTAGLLAVKRCGGITVVQDPHDAAHPEMPQSAIDNVPVDHRVPLKDMGALLERLVAEPAGVSPAVPGEIREEARVAAHGVPVSDPPPEPPEHVCPDCGGPLHKESAPGERLERFRCLVGHAWSRDTLLSSTNDYLESTVWAAIRLFRQRAQLLSTRAGQEEEAGRRKTAHHYRELGQESLEHAHRLQELVMGPLERGDEKEEALVAASDEYAKSSRA